MMRALLLCLLMSLPLQGGMLINSYQFGGAVDLNTGLVAYWKLDETSGNRSAAVGFTLTDTNTVLSATGKVGNAGNFEEATNEYLTATDATAAVVDFSGNQSFTIALWLQLESKTAVTEYAFGKYRHDTNNRSYLLLWDQPTDRLAFIVSGDGTAFTEVSWGSAPSLATWYFVVCRHDAVNDTISINVDNGTPVSAAHSAGVFNSNSDFRIGGRHSNPTSSMWDGLIDEPGIWNIVLTGAQEDSLFNSGNGRTHPF